MSQRQNMISIEHVWDNDVENIKHSRQSYHTNKIRWPWPSFKGYKDQHELIWDNGVENIPVRFQMDPSIPLKVIMLRKKVDLDQVWKVNIKLIWDIDM